MTYYRKTPADTAVGCSAGCLGIAVIFLLNLAILAAAVFVVATIVKAVFHL